MANAIKLDHHHFGVNPKDNPKFHLGRARRAHADVMRWWDDPQEGDAYKAKLLFAIQNISAFEIENHRKEIQDFLNRLHKATHSQLAKAIVKAYVDITVQAAREFGKETAYEREHRVRHGTGGRWVALGAGQYSQAKELSTAQLTALGNAIGSSFSRHQEGAKQKVRWQLRHERTGEVRTVDMDAGELPERRRGEKLIGGPRGLGVDTDDEHLRFGPNLFNAGHALGMSPQRAGQLGDRGQAAANAFKRNWDDEGHAHYGNDTGRAFRTISNASQALSDMAFNHPKAQIAAAVGRLVGDYGPEAEKVLGPHSRKVAYQYRGVERDPVDLPKRGSMSAQQYHDALVGRISRTIPSTQIHQLNLASGYTAPSHGYILDKRNRVLAEAHGYGDDHYLPFRLNGLTRMRGGSYIRTRSTGGPTTEDIYAASISGGKGFTVTSRQGTYEVTFNPDFQHHKRFGDIALGMSKRYGKLLDAVASGKVTVREDVPQWKFNQWVQENETHLLNQAGNDEQLIGQAHETAVKAARVRRDESRKEGHKLELNADGYEYALTALKSQYPFYIDTVRYTPPEDDRFQDKDENGDPWPRWGDKLDRDTGYVKPRHIKTADALVGYFDPRIAGTAQRRPHGITGGEPEVDIDAQDPTGKIRGDVAFYQNWRHNPYARAEDEERRNNDTSPNGGPPRVSSDVDPTTGQLRHTGPGTNLAQGGMSPEMNHDFDRARQAARLHREKNFGRPNWMVHVFGEEGENDMDTARERFKRLYHTQGFQDAMNRAVERHGSEIDQRLTAHQPADENPDLANRTIAEKHTMDEYLGRLSEVENPDNVALRGHLIDVATDLAAQEGRKPDASQAWKDIYAASQSDDPASWAFYHDVPRDRLLEEAFPTEGVDERTSIANEQERKNAQHLMTVEADIRGMEPIVAEIQGEAYSAYLPSNYGGGEAEQTEGAGEEHQTRADVSAEVQRSRVVGHLDLMNQALEQQHKRFSTYERDLDNDPTADKDLLDKIRTKNRDLLPHIRMVQDTVSNASPDSDEEVGRAQLHYDQLLAAYGGRQSPTGMGNMPFDHPVTGEQMHMHELSGATGQPAGPGLLPPSQIRPPHHRTETGKNAHWQIVKVVGKNDRGVPLFAIRKVA
jgi:hypothetical protein